MTNKRIKKNLILNFILLSSQYLYPLISFPIVSRVLGAEGIGKVNMAITFISYFSMFASLGIPTYGIRCVSKVKDDKEKLSRTVQELLIILTMTTFLAMIILIYMIFNVEKLYLEKTLYLVVSINLILNTYGVVWFYQGLELYTYITKRTLIVKTISLIFIILMVKNPSDYIWYGLAAVMTEGGSNLFNLINLRKYIYLKPIKNYQFKKHIKPMILFFTSSIAISIYNKLDVIMIGFLSNDIENGYYAVGIKVVKMLLALVTTINTVLLPQLIIYYDNLDYDNVIKTLKSAIKFAAFIALILIMLIFINGDEIIRILSGNQFSNSIPILYVSSPILIIIAFSGIFSYLILIPLGLEKMVTISHVTGAIVNLSLNYILIPYYGALGAAIATTITELCILLVISYIVYKEKKEIINNIDIKNNVIPPLITTIITVIIFKIFDINLVNDFVNLIINSTGSITLAILILDYMFKFELVRNIKDKVRNSCNILIKLKQ